MRASIDPTAEVNRIRQSLTLIESHLRANPPFPPAVGPSLSPPAFRMPLRASPASSPQSKYRDTHVDSSDTEKPLANRYKAEAADINTTTVTPGMLGQQGSGGLYAGPTSAASNLITHSDRSDSEANDHVVSPADAVPATSTFSPDSMGEPAFSTSPGSSTYNSDLVDLLPPLHLIDALIDCYFDHCNWIYRHVNQPALLAAWARFKAGDFSNHVVLGTVCVLIALAVRYLPPGHAYFASMPGTCEELGDRYYGVMRTALTRLREAAGGLTRAYSLELVELLLVRTHYLTFSKEDPEEVWSISTELVSIGTAMGLHRDPGRTRFDKITAERRRWAWWHIILCERWQAFMFGRPLSIASHHFNTELPSYCDPAIDKSGRLFLPQLALLRLAYVLGHIMNDAVSFRAVPYASVQEKDELLVKWYEAMPTELDLDEYKLSRNFASPCQSLRRIAVQSVVIRSAYHHIRFTLHRPYAKVPASLEIAVSAALALIALVAQTQPAVSEVPGHMNWLPFHVFSAAMFFSFQLIAKPEQPGAHLFREQVHKAMTLLEHNRSMPVADKALTILQALTPLYSDQFLGEPPDERERKKADVLKIVKTLAFPYQDPPYSRSVDSPPNYYQSGANSDFANESFGFAHQDGMQIHEQTQTQMPVSSMRWTPPHPEHASTPSMTHVPPPIAGGSQQQSSRSQRQHPPLHMGPTVSTRYSTLHSMTPYASDQTVQMQQHHPHPSQPFGDDNMMYVHPADQSSMWGASVGFGLGEWSQILNVPAQNDGDNRRKAISQ
ncbi:hypothetical protein AcV5_000559 [Taiwanofungus camphoratus]|nr:hypothetical protein AcV5_000559 [Antrodia cinnamomea]